MVVVLFLLAGILSFCTWAEQHPNDAAAGRALATRMKSETDLSAGVILIAREEAEDTPFIQGLQEGFKSLGVSVRQVARGAPAQAREVLEKEAREKTLPAAVATNHIASKWQVLDRLGENFPSLSKMRVFFPQSYYWPNFLKRDNLLNIANQIAVIAILAIGMTLVIITGGIDLSVGSLIALSAVVTARLIRDYGGGVEASNLALLLCSLGAIFACALCGAFSGGMITLFAIPPFIATLGMMLIAGGLGYLISHGESIDRIPERFMWLGRGADLFTLPNAVVLMITLYLIAHLLMTRTVLGRCIYAVGGNPEAARLSGIRGERVLLTVYALCGALAGLGGVVMASQLKSGAPTYGQMYELYTIAAVVVGGTSLAGGEGKVLGTLAGALIIAVIQNGMNLLGFESNTQKVILGSVLLVAVLLDRLKARVN
ncbi:MAG: ABC transporter permease [Gemmataceae bacterium]|nr:ABC transporter permease [Gemmataceae bacterium]